MNPYWREICKYKFRDLIDAASSKPAVVTNFEARRHLRLKCLDMAEPPENRAYALEVLRELDLEAAGRAVGQRDRDYRGFP